MVHLGALFVYICFPSAPLNRCFPLSYCIIILNYLFLPCFGYLKSCLYTNIMWISFSVFLASCWDCCSYRSPLVLLLHQIQVWWVWINGTNSIRCQIWSVVPQPVKNSLFQLSFMRKFKAIKLSVTASSNACWLNSADLWITRLDYQSVVAKMILIIGRTALDKLHDRGRSRASRQKWNC